ncbi:hypothetical protein BKA67DRAFT_648618 [Truncatella angustata]|uniref:Uncharacterized protein n=1 Tax=Truncatella angustata TaxID=152316 RepID=A0A9P8ZSW0_9PEZI|nr:uncharacterized protein BKA67DRAFT_648618 [Truncatella angustata]KAH6648605.1 hypothetical protein BKA67DRAFT_648618 [Truncatella angustata]KAH8199485.1 hypothetical protein TruAng_006361 [Truncatella angustata]
MCIIEYLGYACGHSTVHVQRPCPLTTHLHTNPVCPNPAERPTQVHANCPTCARILHTRWVEIVTLEHQWMHERGTCGCDVVFPALQQPRVVGKVRLDRGSGDKNGSSNSDDPHVPQQGSRDGHGDDAPGATEYPPRCGPTGPDAQHTLHGPAGSSGENGSRGRRWQKRNRVKRKNQKDVQADLHARSKPKDVKEDSSIKSYPAKKPHALAWNSCVLSPLIEVSEPSSTGKPPKTTITVRLSSQYGAEWIPEHAALHAAGKCHCPVRFETYKPHMLTAEDIAEFAPDWKPDAPIRALQRASPRSTDVMIWRINEDASAAKQIDWPTKMEEFGFKSVAEAEAWLEATRAGATPSGALAEENFGQLPPGVPGMPIFDDLGNLQYPMIAYGYDPTQVMPMHTAHPPTASRERAWSLTQHESPATELSIAATPGQPIYHQHHGLALVGWPLGAGPEGGIENSHSPAWNMCQLSRPALKRCKSCPALENSRIRTP